MEVKIKNGNEMVDATIEMIDGVMVASPKVEYIPKDGDVVAYFNHDKPTIYVYKGGCKYNTSFYVAYSEIRNEVFATKVGHLDRDRNDIRPATEKEKKLLFDKLAEKGWEWKADTKEIVKLKWKPKKDEIYFMPCCDVSGFHVRSFEWEDAKVENKYYEKNWIYKTREKCQEFCNRLNDAINSVKP